MRADWHYIKNGKEHGPVTFEELQRLAATGELKETDEVWKQGSAADWTAAPNVPGLFDGTVPVTSPVPESVLDPEPSASDLTGDNPGQASTQKEPLHFSSDQPGPKPMQPDQTTPKVQPCPDCGHTVSLRAAACPKCGAPLKPEASVKPMAQDHDNERQATDHISRSPKRVPATQSATGESWEAVAWGCWVVCLGLGMIVVTSALTWFEVPFGKEGLAASIFMTLIGASSLASFVPTSTRLKPVAFFNLAAAILGVAFSSIYWLFSGPLTFWLLGSFILSIWEATFVLYLGGVAVHFRQLHLAANSKRFLSFSLGAGLLVIGLNLLFHHQPTQQTRANLTIVEIFWLSLNLGWALMVLIWLVEILVRTERMIRIESQSATSQSVESDGPRSSPLWSLLEQPDFGWTSASGKLKILAVLLIAWAAMSCFAAAKIFKTPDNDHPRLFWSD